MWERPEDDGYPTWREMAYILTAIAVAGVLGVVFG